MQKTKQGISSFVEVAREQSGEVNPDDESSMNEPPQESVYPPSDFQDADESMQLIEVQAVETVDPNIALLETVQITPAPTAPTMAPTAYGQGVVEGTWGEYGHFTGNSINGPLYPATKAPAPTIAPPPALIEENTVQITPAPTAPTMAPTIYGAGEIEGAWGSNGHFTENGEGKPPYPFGEMSHESDAEIITPAPTVFTPPGADAPTPAPTGVVNL